MLPSETKKKFAKFFQSKPAKKIILVLGGLFYILVVFIAFKPEPFIKYGYFGVFAFNLFGPGIILVSLLSRHMNILGISIAGSLGMAMNDSVGWLVGRSGDVILPRTRKIERFEKQIEKWDYWALFFWAFIPFPYDFIAMIAGYLEIPYKRFVIPVFIARVIRFFLIGSGVVAIWGRTLP